MVMRWLKLFLSQYEKDRLVGSKCETSGGNDRDLIYILSELDMERHNRSTLIYSNALGD